MKYCPECAAPLAPAVIDNVDRLVCESENCGFIQWNNPIPVVAALVECEGKYIIANNVKWPANIFSLITGYLEAGETPEQAVLREVAEELGLAGSIKHFLGHYSLFARNQLILCFEITATGVIKTNHELAELKLLTPEELAEYNFAPLNITQQIVRQWAKRYLIPQEN